MRTTTLLAILLSLFSNSLFAQYSGYWSYKGYADAKGEVVAVHFNNDTIKLWRIGDGELVYNDKPGAFGYASKMLRYKIQDVDWKKRDISISKSRMNSYDGSEDSYSVKYGPEYFTGFGVKIDYAGTGKTFFDVDNKITLFKEEVAGETTLYNVLHLSSPDFKGTGPNYTNMKKVLKRKGLEYQYLFDPLISPSGKYAFLYNYGVMVSLEKNKELWNITQKPGKNYQSFHIAFSMDESQIAVTDIEATPYSIFIYSVNKGNKEGELVLPLELQKRLKTFRIFPASDMKSYIVDGEVNNENFRECWLVKADGTTQKLKLQ
ncbi:MAG: hypothetical protein IPI66_10185 [Chitinophagaceae bacterium]|nr:hypothetical protein [Chitinophagaceae bacterium]MBL0055252.1 hypothetical protein [Chitinophagaceae bacterium]